MDAQQQAVITYIESVMGMPVTRFSSGRYVLHCPFHRENSASFHVYPDGHVHCYGCRFHGWLVNVIAKQEGLTLALAFRRMRDLKLDTPLAEPVPRATRSPLPNDDERLALTIAVDTFYEAWHDRTMGRPGRDYIFQTRRVVGPYASALRIAYAPWGYGRMLWPRLKKLFPDRALPDGGKELDRWKAVARSTGLMNDRGTEKLDERVIFPCYDGQGVVWYQGRSIGDRRPKCMNPALRKHFYVPLPYAKEPGTYLVEGPVDALSVATFGYHAVAVNGSGWVTAGEIKTWAAPIYAFFDRDEAGDGYRRQIRGLCERAAVPLVDILVPGGADDPNQALQVMGPEAFREAIKPAVAAMVAA